jgi:hypothetical protein
VGRAEKADNIEFLERKGNQRGSERKVCGLKNKNLSGSDGSAHSGGVTKTPTEAGAGGVAGKRKKCTQSPETEKKVVIKKIQAKRVI